MAGEEIKKSLYLLYGPEKFLIEEKIKKIKKDFGELKIGINYIELSSVDVLELIPNLETPAFGFEKKLIIIKDSGLFKKDTKGNPSLNREKIEKYLNENFDFISKYNIIIFYEEDVQKNLNLFKFCQKNGIIEEFNFLKPFQVKDRLKKICIAYKVEISDENLIYLIENVRNKYARFNK